MTCCRTRIYSVRHRPNGDFKLWMYCTRIFRSVQVPPNCRRRHQSHAPRQLAPLERLACPERATGLSVGFQTELAHNLHYSTDNCVRVKTAHGIEDVRGDLHGGILVPTIVPRRKSFAHPVVSLFFPQAFVLKGGRGFFNVPRPSISPHYQAVGSHAVRVQNSATITRSVGAVDVDFLQNRHLLPRPQTAYLAHRLSVSVPTFGIDK